jgi:hypothetical protein
MQLCNAYIQEREEEGCWNITVGFVFFKEPRESFLKLFLKFSAAAFCSELVSLPRNGSGRQSERLFLFFVARKGIPLCSLPRNSSERNSENFLLFWFHGTEFRVVFLSAERLGTLLWEVASIFVSRNGIPSCFLFRGRVRNGIPRFSVSRNNRNSVGNNYLFRLFRLPRNYFFVGNSQPYSGAVHCSVYGVYFNTCIKFYFSYISKFGRIYLPSLIANYNTAHM